MQLVELGAWVNNVCMVLDGVSTTAFAWAVLEFSAEVGEELLSKRAGPGGDGGGGGGIQGGNARAKVLRDLHGGAVGLFP